MKRMRGRNHRSSGGGGGGGPIRHHNGNIPLNRNHVFDSSGPDLRIRGTAQQLFEKYLQLGRDATSSGDRVMAESYFQHAEHYFRILNAMTQAQQNQSQGGGQHVPNNGGQGQGQSPNGGSYNREGQANHQRRTGAQELEQVYDDQPDPLIPAPTAAESGDRHSEPQEPVEA